MTTTSKTRTPGETTMKVRAFGKVERLSADIRKMQDAETERRGKYEERLKAKQGDRDEAQREYNAFLESEIAAEKDRAKP